MVGIVIVSYRSDDLTVRFVREDLSRISVPYRVVVVDNGETGSSALQEKLPEVTVLVSENRGYASACNLGAEWLRDQVHPESVLFCNNDLRFLSDRVVETLCETLSAHPEVGAIGPCIVGPDGRRQSPEPYRGLWNRYVWMYVLTPFLSRDRKIRKFQLDYAESRGFGRIHLPMEFLLGEGDDPILGTIAEKCAAPLPLMLDTFTTAEEASANISPEELEERRQRISQRLGRLIKELMNCGVHRRILIIGGDTLLALMDELDCASVTPLCEPDRGVVLFELEYAGETRRIMSKSGGFGSEDLLTRL